MARKSLQAKVAEMHWCDCATNRAPAYPAGDCDEMQKGEDEK